MIAYKGDWVEVEQLVLDANSRVDNIPQDTKGISLKSYIQGFLENESATIGDKVTISSIIGRIHKGKLSDINPSFKHDFGKPIPELLTIGEELRTAIKDGAGRFDDNE